MTVTPAELAATSGQDPAPRAFRLMESGRLDPSPATWARPLPPVLWSRLSKQDREAHERLVQGFADAAARAADAKTKLRETEASDEQALRKALSAGDRPGKPKAPAAEAQAEQAQREAKVAAELVIESGGALVRLFSDEQMEEAIAEAREEANRIVQEVAEQAAALQARLAETAVLSGQIVWISTLLDRRYGQPWATRSSPLSHRLASAGQHLHEVEAFVAAELSEIRHRAAPPAQHHKPPGAPVAGEWPSPETDAPEPAPDPDRRGFVAGPIDPRR